VPDWLIIVLVVLGALVLLLALGGGLAVGRRRRRDEPAFEARLDEANRALAAAHAEDKGWEPGALRDAARRAFEGERPGTTVREMTLVQVVDRPGVHEDEAVFRFETEDGAVHHLTLGRSEAGWRLDRIS
jgi:hypothetical protein